MKYKITYISSKGEEYSEIEEPIDEEYAVRFKEGVWYKPFPNEKENSLAFGLAESLLQSDWCPPYFHYNDIVTIKVEKFE